MKELIFEELSISEEVVGYSNIIIQKIEESIDDNGFQSQFFVKIDFLYLSNIPISLLNFSSLEELNDNLKNFKGVFFRRL